MRNLCTTILLLLWLSLAPQAWAAPVQCSSTYEEMRNHLSEFGERMVFMYADEGWSHHIEVWYSRDSATLSFLAVPRNNGTVCILRSYNNVFAVQQITPFEEVEP